MRPIDGDALIEEIAKIPDLRTLSTKTIGEAIGRMPTIETERKTIPAKPIEKVDEYNENLIYLYCPSCKHWIGIWNDRLKRGDMYNNSNRSICAYCGQAIQLEEAENY